MTIDKELTTSSLNCLGVATEEGKQVLLVGLKEGFRDKPQYARSLKREFSQCHDFCHPHLIKYLRFEEASPYGPCIVMEWEDARTLADFMRESHTEEEKKAVIVQVAEAVGYLHSNGFVHGALSADTVFVTKKGNQVKLLNFRPRYSDSLRMPHEVTAYLAPEAKDGTVALDARADIFSLGVMVKEINLGPDYEGVVAGCCSYGRYQRYESTDAFLSALEHRRYSRPSSSSQSEEGRNNRTKLIIGAVIALLIVALIVFFNSNSKTETEAKQASTEQTDSAKSTAPESEQAAPADPDDSDASAQSAAPTPNAGTPTSAGNDFLTTLVPQMQKDIDRIYAPYAGRDLTPAEKAQLSRRRSRYYRGLRRTLKGKTPDEMAAFDKAFADYVKQKNAQ